MSRRSCPACGGRVGRDNLMCPSCGFVVPLDQPLAPPPRAPEPPATLQRAPQPPAPKAQRAPRVSSAGPVAAPVAVAGPALVDIPIPGTRQWSKLLFAAVFIGLFVVGGADPILTPLFLIGGAAYISSDVFSVLGWEHVRVTDTELVVDRRLFGRSIKSLRVPRAELESVWVDPEPKGIRKLWDGHDKDQNLWTFGDGPIVITTTSAEYRFAQGLIDEEDLARDVVARLDRELGLAEVPA